MDLSKVEERGGSVAMEKYRSAFGQNWVETRQKPNSEKGERQVRLKPLNEFREKLEAPGKFLLIEGEEISDRSQGVPVHLNATNLSAVISPIGGATVPEAINNNLRAAEEQAKQTGEPILVHLNHPNFGWAVTAEELAGVTNERFFELYNGHPSVNHLGDETRPGVEKMWDIVNTIRLDQFKAKPMFGLATDDSHNYHGCPGSHTGRGWVMVRTEKLDPRSLIEAMNQGDFYSSSGIELQSIHFDQRRNTLSLKIKSQAGATYSTQFIGTKSNYVRRSVVQLDSESNPIRATRVYSKDVGGVLATSASLEPSYQLTGDELFVRAVVTSSRDHADPSFPGQKEQAWSQPFGWKTIDR